MLIPVLCEVSLYRKAILLTALSAPHRLFALLCVMEGRCGFCECDPVRLNSNPVPLIAQCPCALAGFVTSKVDCLNYVDSIAELLIARLLSEVD